MSNALVSIIPSQLGDIKNIHRFLHDFHENEIRKINEAAKQKKQSKIDAAKQECKDAIAYLQSGQYHIDLKEVLEPYYIEYTVTSGWFRPIKEIRRKLDMGRLVQENPSIWRKLNEKCSAYWEDDPSGFDIRDIAESNEFWMTEQDLINRQERKLNVLKFGFDPSHHVSSVVMSKGMWDRYELKNAYRIVEHFDPDILTKYIKLVDDLTDKNIIHIPIHEYNEIMRLSKLYHYLNGESLEMQE